MERGELSMSGNTNYTVGELIKALKKCPKDDDVQIYILENGGDLVHADIESIIETLIGCEITVEKYRQST
tara:strand:+ start:1342 stop:1551 length:210 start_codon:yes stop_codon:yes gene_type:complete